MSHMFKNMKIQKKLILTFILVATITTCASIMGLSGLISMNAAYSSALVDYGFSQGDIGKFNAEFDTSRAYTQDVLLSVEDNYMEAAAKNYAQSNKLVDQYLKAMRQTMVNEKELAYYNTIQSEYQKYVAIENQVVEMSRQYNKSGAYDLLRTDGTAHADKIKAAVNALIKLKTDTGYQLSSDLAGRGTLFTVMTALILLISLILSCFIAFRISRSISRPVKDMADAAQDMAGGNLNVRFRVDSSDEIGMLGKAFLETAGSIKKYITDIRDSLSSVERGNLTLSSQVEYKGDFIELRNSIDGIVDSLNETMAHINEASEQVSFGSQRVSDGALALARGAAEQTDSIRQFNSTLKGISDHIRENASNAAHASDNVRGVRSEIETCNGDMQEMIRAMSLINGSSHQIETIIKTIQDIAFQTNILSLNAAVEAARAGDAGKGFAVVADEVRRLAVKSAEAVKDTTALIRNSIRQVESGTKIANETARSLRNVVESTEAVSGAVEKISQATSLQSDSITRAIASAEQISKVVQTNSTAAKEDAATSEELSEQARLLKDLVNRFRLKTEPESSEAQTAEASPKPLELTEVRQQSPRGRLCLSRAGR